MKKGLPILLLAAAMLLSMAPRVHAQVNGNPTAIPTVAATPTTNAPTNPTAPGSAGARPVFPTHISIANCDVCGYCNGMTADAVPGRWQSCRQCLYPDFGEGEVNPLDNRTIQGTVAGIPTTHPNYIYTDLGCLSTLPDEFATQISSFFFSIVGGLAFLFFIYGAGIIATSRSDPGKLNHGKRVIYGSIMGLVFALFSVFIIRFIAQGIGVGGF